ncbi:hypothetical protein Rhal01_00632 [Rubritalea halochordaticola]|uniref:DUF1570 domain-containing protein n=1 Tax=Rubritalea halochordaticola TaxID=714537 RepID=A0ABP9UVI0_9BACT
MMKAHPSYSLWYLLLLIVSGSLHGDEELDWPSQLINKSSPPVSTPDSDSPPYHYTTKTFQFISNEKIAIDKIRSFAVTAESVPAALSRIPLPLYSPPEDEKGGKVPIYIFSDTESFIRAGGKRSSSGYYSGRKKSVYLRSDHFTKVPIGRLPNYRLLVHELTHMSTHGVLGYLPSWLSEGTAEYMSAAFIPKGSYRFDDMVRRIPAHAKKFIDTKAVVELPKFENLIAMSNRQWGEELQKLNEDESFYPHYLAALIITHYVYHLDPQGRENCKTYISMLKDRKSIQEANTVLFPHEIRKELPQKLEKYWQQRGLKIRFQK